MEELINLIKSDDLYIAGTMIFFIIVPLIIIFRFLKKNDRRLSSYNGLEEHYSLLDPRFSSKDIMEDLQDFIRKDCETVWERDVSYMSAIYASSMEFSPLNRRHSVIDDKNLNELVTKVSNRIIDKMSDGYRNRLLLIFKEDYIDDFIVEEVYSILLDKAVKLNIEAGKTNKKR